MPTLRLSTTAFLPDGSALPCTETTISSGPLRTSGSALPLHFSSRSHPATCTSHTALSSTPTTSISCGGQKRLIPTETSRRIRTWVVSLVVSSLLRDQAHRRRWGRDPHSTVTERGSRRCELSAEPICRPVSGRRIAGSILRLKRVGRLFVGYRVTCLHPGRARRAYLTGLGTERNRKYRLPTYGTLSRGGDLALRQRRVMTDTDTAFLHFSFTIIYTFRVP